MQPNDTSSAVHHTTDVLAMALDAAAEHGWSVFPIRHKIPAISKDEGGRGFHDASTLPQRIVALFNTRGGRTATGYGVRTGRSSGVIVADADGVEGVRQAKELGITSDLIVRSGRPESWHLYLSIPDGVEVKSAHLGPNLHLKAEGGYVCGPGSVHPDGPTYQIVRDGVPSPAPPEIIALANSSSVSENDRSTGERRGPVSVDLAGPPIPDGARNDSLARIAGRLHDGTRSLDQLTADLLEINQARCTPPLRDGEVRKIGASIFGKEPCSPAPEPTPSVKDAVEYLRSVRRQVKGMGGSTGWAIYNGLLDHASRHGRRHEQGVSISIDMRTAARLAGTNGATVSRWIRRTDLISVLRRGSGQRGSILLLHVPESEGQRLQHSSTRVFREGHARSRSVATSALQRSIYRLRWSGGSAKARHGVAKGTSKVRQGVTPARDGMRRIGKSKAAILSVMVDCSGEMSLCALAERLGRSKRSMREPLKWLVDNGLINRVRRGYYDLPEDFVQRLDDARELGGEPLADRLQIAEHARQRVAYRGRESGETREAGQERRERRDGGRDARRQRDDHRDDGRGTAASRANVEASRRKREEHFRRQREQQRGVQHTTEEERRKRARVRELIRQGMSPEWAKAEVYDPGGSPFDRGEARPKEVCP